MAARLDSRFSLAEWAAIWAVVVIWGINNAAAKFATEALPPLLVGGMRFAVALAFLLPFIVRPPYPDWKALLPVVLILGPLHFGVVYWGFAVAHNLSLYSISLQLWIPLTALFSWLLLRESMSRLAMGGMAVAFAGVAWMMLDPQASKDALAVLFGVASSVLWALGTVLVRRLPPVRALKLQGWIAVFAAPMLLVGAAATEPNLAARVQAASWQVWASIVYAGLISSVGATVALFWLVQRREASRFTPYLLATPLVSSALGVLLFGDHLTLRLVLGAATTLGGVALVAVAERLRAQPRSEIELEAS